MRNKDKNQIRPFSCPLFFPGSTSLFFSSPTTQGLGNGELRSVCSSSALPLFFLTLFPFSTLCLSHTPWGKTGSCVGSPQACSVDICSGVVFSTGCRELPAPLWSPLWVAGAHLLWCLKHHLTPLLLLLWPYCLCCHFSLFTPPILSACVVLLPFLKHVFTEVPPAWPVGSAASCGGATAALGGTGWTVWARHRAAPDLPAARSPALTPKTIPDKMFMHEFQTSVKLFWKDLRISTIMTTRLWYP